MSEYNQPKTFRNQPILIGIGPDAKQIEVADLPYGKHREFIQIVTSIWMRSKALPVTGEMFSRILSVEVANGKQPVDAIKAIQDNVLDMYKTSSEDEKIHLLKLLTGDQITDSDIEVMTGAEINGLLEFLIDNNLKSEKNLEASLNSILNPNAQTIEK